MIHPEKKSNMQLKLHNHTELLNKQNHSNINSFNLIHYFTKSENQKANGSNLPEFPSCSDILTRSEPPTTPTVTT